jgi:hypothetical protein
VGNSSGKTMHMKNTSGEENVHRSALPHMHLKGGRELGKPDGTTINSSIGTRRGNACESPLSMRGNPPTRA